MTKRKTISRRRLIVTIGASCVGATVLGAWTPPRVSAQPATTTAPAPSVSVGPVTSETPHSGGTLRFGNVGEFVSLEPQTIRPGGIMDQLFCMWDQLITVDANQQPQPMLAESWDISDDYQHIKFNLRKGVQFHTGREMTADDVKWSLLRIQDLGIGSSLSGRFAPMTGVQTPDKYTVILDASRPWGEAFDVFNQATIIDPITFQSAGLTQPTGTGAFMFAEYAQGDHVRLVRNPNYWRSGIPYMDEVLVSIHRDAQAAVVGLESGALDLISVGMPITDMLRLQNDPNYQVLINGKTGTSWVAILNCTAPPTDNKLVRQALSYALDRKRMADAVWHGLERPLVLPWSEGSPAYDADKNRLYAFDLDKARSLLATSGVTETSLDIIWMVGTPEFETMAQIYQADLAKIGFNVTLRPLDSAIFLDIANNFKYQGVRLATHSLGNLTPASNTTGGTYGPASNLAGFKDDAYTMLVNQVVTETDPAKQQQLYNQLNDYYLDQAWALHIVQNPEHAVARSNVRGLEYDARPALPLADLWLA